MPLPGLPEGCRIERAERPRGVATLEWKPCERSDGEALPGCRVRRDGSSLRIVGAGRDRAWTWVRLLDGDLAGGRIQGLAEIDGPLHLALRERQDAPGDPISCRVTALGAGGGRWAFVVQSLAGGTAPWARLHIGFFDVADRDRESSLELAATAIAGGRTITRLWVSATTVALQTSPDGALHRVRDGKFETLAGVAGTPQNVALVEDHLLWETWRGSDHVGLAHAPAGVAGNTWRTRTDSDTKSFGTDGGDLAWMQGRGRGPGGAYVELGLWTTAYREDLERSEPRRLRSMAVRNPAVVGGGWYAMRRVAAGPQRVEVFSLRDGARRTFVSPDGLVLDTPFFASEGEVLFPGRRAIRFDPRLLPVDREP